MSTYPSIQWHGALRHEILVTQGKLCRRCK